MAEGLALIYAGPPAGVNKNMFGKDVANFQLFHSLVQHGGFAAIDFMMRDPVPAERLRAILQADGSGRSAVRSTGLLDHAAAERAGTLLIGKASLEDRSWLRRKASGETSYSLVGLIHTIAPQAVRQDIASASVAPVHPWDAIICTSPSVRSAMIAMFDEWESYLIDRFDASEMPRPQLPLIPLGIDGAAFRDITDRPDARAQARSAMGMAEDDVLLIWVGRLSFYEKAFPQPMMLAAELAAQRTGKRVHFAMAGWFPHHDDETRYRDAAAHHAPSVRFHIVDGNDASKVEDLWSASDIFISLADNIQETFGLTPLEAMACGRPVVVSDWDGYRFTVVDGEQGFLIPTLFGLPGMMGNLDEQHLVGLKTYQQYVGLVAQHTAVDVGRAAESISALIDSPDLRRRMGEAGQRRIHEMFDHRVVAPQYSALADELATIRGRAPASGARHSLPVRGDPLCDFAGFATNRLDRDVLIRVRDRAGLADLAQCHEIELDLFGSRWRLSKDQMGQILSALIEEKGMTVGTILDRIPTPSHGRTLAALAWMAKMGIVEWGAPARQA